MNIKDYATGYSALYADFAEAVAKILQDAIALDGHYHLQQITRRAKDPVSLRDKLKARRLLRSTDIEKRIKDLAGCRLVFYTNGDVDRFLHSAIIGDNFVVDWDKTKFHHASERTNDAETMFRGTNYVVRLKEARGRLPEYSRFAGLICEVQVQTTLNHAWSEMAHDTIYKHPTLKGFGGHLMEGIRTRMAAIMTDHLIPAGYEFQKVAADFARLSSGNRLFESGVVAQLKNCRDNNERYAVLQQFNAHVLPYIDDVRAIHNELRSALFDLIATARRSAPVPIETSAGNIPGSTSLEVTRLALDAADAICHVDEAAVAATFNGLCRLNAQFISDDERKRLLESSVKLSKNQLAIWKIAGPIVQLILVRKDRYDEG